MSPNTKGLFKQVSEETEALELTLPTIIDVPRWLASIELQIAALYGVDKKAVDEPLDEGRSLREGPPPRQQQLF